MRRSAPQNDAHFGALGPFGAGVRIAEVVPMPRRNAPDSLSLAVGERIRTLRIEGGMTIEELADESATGSKGHLSNIERGLVRPNIHTLKQVADGLGVKPLDLMTFPKKSTRERLIDLTRDLSPSRLSDLVRQLVALVRGRA
jgi:transcriptional regulator with XRE-family HTH domain